MSKKAYLIAFGSFVAGILVGVGVTYFFSMAYWGKQTGEGMALMKEVQIAEYGQRAFTAYQHESSQVAIYALSQYLDLLAETEKLVGENAVFMTKHGINFDTMLAQARLAKVYAAAGQSDRSAQQIADALARASRDQRLGGVTNEAMLMEIVVRSDKGATK